MNLRILQAIAWINVAFGALILCGGLVGTYAYFRSQEAERPDYVGYFLIGISLCMGIAFLLTGRAFLKQKTPKTAESSASGFAVLIWLMSSPLFPKIISDEVRMPLGTIFGILIAYACFLAIKRLVIKPCFTTSPAI
ncbi:MAG: hypothetical protein H7067_16560 [Burkholderiales bacterium]|nr:hypothetical protein [Opitutaceae bacterium]